MGKPPCTLLKSLATVPSTAATTGVPRGARMSIASCWRLPPRVSAKLSFKSGMCAPSTGRRNGAASGTDSPLAIAEPGEAGVIAAAVAGVGRGGANTGVGIGAGVVVGKGIVGRGGRVRDAGTSRLVGAGAGARGVDPVGAGRQ